MLYLIPSRNRALSMVITDKSRISEIFKWKYSVLSLVIVPDVYVYDVSP